MSHPVSPALSSSSRSIGQILLRSTYGISGEEGDHLIRSNEQCVRAFSASSGKGANLVNAFPIRKPLISTTVYEHHDHSYSQQ